MQNLGIKRDILNAIFWVSIFWVVLDYRKGYCEITKDGAKNKYLDRIIYYRRHK